MWTGKGLATVFVVFVFCWLDSAQAARYGSVLEGWIAATHGSRHKRFLTRAGEDVGVGSIAPGLDLIATTAINIRVGPADWHRKPVATIPTGSAFKVLSKKTVGNEVWLKVVPMTGLPAGLALAGSLYGRRIQPPGEVAAVDLATKCKEGLAKQVAAQDPNAKPEDRDIYYDTDGLIVHRDADGSCNGGDTAQREGWYWFGVWLRNHTPGAPPFVPNRKWKTFHEVLRLLEPAHDGLIYRHPKLAPWNDPFSNDLGTSRDQLVPIVAAMGVWGETDALGRLWERMPQDASGKHAFNGSWRTIGGAGWDCESVLHTNCSPSLKCDLNRDTRACDANVDSRDCSAGQDNRECSQPRDDRGCGDLDLICKAARDGQNAIYAHNKAACEAAKAAANGMNAAGKVSCEAQKAAQNVAYDGAKGACEAAKAATNEAYDGVQKACLLARAGGKAACEGYQQVAFNACRLSNIFTGDPFGPEYINLVLRALKRDPRNPNNDILNPPSIFVGGALGELELLGNTHLRIGAGHSNRDDVGPDLNHMVALIQERLVFSDAVGDDAVHQYAVQRTPSYGSYLEQYYTKYGRDEKDMIGRIDAGIASGWQPDPGISAPFGVAKWYHRPSEGANPALAKLYAPILDFYLK